ncbi:hypothetical protein RhiLY_05955 [Ceratobasidium sp. AG-Ba]|nr:hypothetical protein RhiLY_05955 [Ceratobasidium sp. AG-Ba]
MEPMFADAERWHPNPELVVAKTPTDARIKLGTLEQRNDAPRLLPSLTRYLKDTCPVFKQQIPTLVTSETKVQSWSRARLFHSPPPFKPSEGPHIDVVRAQPTKFNRFDRVSRPARFDTVLISDKEQRGGIHRYMAARVRAIFELPPGLHYLCDKKLAYVDKFYSPSPAPEPDVGLYTVTRALQDGSADLTLKVEKRERALGSALNWPLWVGRQASRECIAAAPSQLTHPSPSNSILSLSPPNASESLRAGVWENSTLSSLGNNASLARSSSLILAISTPSSTPSLTYYTESKPGSDTDVPQGIVELSA